MNPKSKFKIGDKLLHRSKTALGIVIGIINIDDPDDIVSHGFRYNVTHSGYTWSVPESALLLVEKNINNYNDPDLPNSAILPNSQVVALRTSLPTLDPKTGTLKAIPDSNDGEKERA